MRGVSWVTALSMAGCGIISGLDGLKTEDAGADASTADAADAADAAGGDTSPLVEASGNCPNEQGRYTMQLSGAGCSQEPPTGECVVQKTQCSIMLSPASGPVGFGISGTTSIASDGSFTGAAITEGNMSRSGCTGTWSDNSTGATLIVTCGGTSGSQSCVATLTRTSLTCN